MKAAVFYGAHDFRVEDVEEPRIESTDILIKVKACGICGSDLHAYKEGLFSRPGFVMGHELSGEVVAVGSDVRDIKAGERVVPMLIPFNEFLQGCGECFWCLRGQPQWCPTNIHKPCGECDYCKAGQFWMCDDMQRHMMLGYSRNGGYAEYVTVPYAKLNVNVFKIPDSVSWEEASFVEPLWGAYRWVMMANPQPYDVAVVIGLGTIGLLVMEVMKLFAGKVIVIEMSEKRLQLAKELGADVTINVNQEEDPVKKIIELTGSGRSYAGKGGGCADIVMECSGAGIALRQAMEMTRSGGRIVLVGLFEKDVPINANLIIHKQLNLISSFGWGTREITKEISEAIKLLGEKKVNVKPLISHQFPVGKIMEAFEAQTKPEEAVKVLIKPEMS